jgi:hypothetical protein
VLCGAPIVNSDSFPLDAIFPDHSLVSERGRALAKISGEQVAVRAGVDTVFHSECLTLSTLFVSFFFTNTVNPKIDAT